MNIPTSTIKAVLNGQRNFTAKQLTNCNETSVNALVRNVLSWNLLPWTRVKENSIVRQSGDGITVSEDGTEATLIVSRASKYQDVWTDNTLIFEAQSPKEYDETMDLTRYRQNPKLINAINDRKLDVQKLKIFHKRCSNGWEPYDFSGKFIEIVPHLTTLGDLQFIINMRNPTPQTGTLMDPKQVYLFALFIIFYRFF